MLKIGEFARLSRVSVKTLRYYDEIGLLQPARIDRYTGYRYYTAAQYARLTRILALRDLGLSLEQIAALLNADLSTEQFHGMLLLKRAELRQSHAAIGEQLARIEAQIAQLQQEGTMSSYDVILKSVAPLRAAVVRGVIPNEAAVTPTFNRLFDEALGFVGRNGAKFAGPAIALWLENSDPQTDQDMPVAAAVPTSLDNGGDGSVPIEDLPGVETMACLVHQGPFTTLGPSYGALMQWIEQNGYHVAGPNREVYLSYDRNSDGSDYVTELQFPVAKG